MRNRLLFFTVFVACLFLVPPLVASAAEAAPAEPDASGLLITAFLVLGFALWRRRRAKVPARAPE